MMNASALRKMNHGPAATARFSLCEARMESLAAVGAPLRAAQSFFHANMLRRGFKKLFAHSRFDCRTVRVDARHPRLHNCNYGQVLSVRDM
jgi:hypothetical protein